MNRLIHNLIPRLIQGRRIHPSVAVVHSVGLPTPAVALDLSEKPSGSFPNHGIDGSTFTPFGGTVAYQQAFPSTIGGTGLQFVTSTTDGIAADGAQGQPAAGESWAIFATFSGTPGAGSILECRDVSFGAGFECRVSLAGVPTIVFEDDGGTTASLTGSGDHMDGNDNYIGISCDFADGNVYASSNVFAEASVALTGVDNVTPSSAFFKSGLSQRDAFGAGSGILRHLYVWTGPSGEGIREADWDALYVALGGTL